MNELAKLAKKVMGVNWGNQTASVRSDFAGMNFFEKIIDSSLDTSDVLATARVQLTEDFFEGFSMQLRTR